jgi:hypothetical protein
MKGGQFAALMLQGLKTGMHDLPLFELQSERRAGMNNEYGSAQPVAQLFKRVCGGRSRSRLRPRFLVRCASFFRSLLESDPTLGSLEGPSGRVANKLGTLVKSSSK